MALMDDARDFLDHWTPDGWVEREVGRVSNFAPNKTQKYVTAVVQIIETGGRGGEPAVRVKFKGQGVSFVFRPDAALELADYLIRAADDIETV